MAAISIQRAVILNPTITASVTEVDVANIYPDTYASLNLRIDIVCSSVVSASGITVKLQSKGLGGDFADLLSANASVAITTNGTVSILLNKETAADLVDMPLNKTLRLVITTGAGDSLSIDNASYQTA